MPVFRPEMGIPVTRACDYLIVNALGNNNTDGKTRQSLLEHETINLYVRAAFF